MRKSRKLRWRSRKEAEVERRFFETIFIEVLREMLAEGQVPVHSLGKVAPTVIRMVPQNPATEPNDVPRLVAEGPR